jgi:potassium voltage-gated channel Eag-related subfamily H protein 5
VYYVTAYYWGTIIVTTIGFGDISCGNWKEAVVVSIIVMFTSIILGFNLSEFNAIFSNLRASSQKVSQKKAIFKRMVTRDENNNATIDPSLKKQIYKFIEDEGLDKGDIQFSERNEFI